MRGEKIINYFDERDWKRIDVALDSGEVIIHVRSIGEDGFADEERFDRVCDELRRINYSVVLGKDCVDSFIYVCKKREVAVA